MLDWFINDFHVLGLHIQRWIAAFALMFAIWALAVWLDRRRFRNDRTWH